jgi:2-methylisocitrate lyase-like PEP mutase family enzyme
MPTLSLVTSTKTLRQLLLGEPFMAGDCYSALTARIIQMVGFPAAYMGGHSTGMMHYAIPDYGVFTPTEMIEQAGRVAEAIDIPLVVDADEAGVTVDSIYRTVRRYEHAGVAGIHIEDEAHPKHSPLDGPLIPVDDMRARISAAVQGRRSDEFVVIARCNEFQVPNGGGTGSLDAALERAAAYAEAGADAFLPPFATAEHIDALAREVDIPIGGYGPLLPHMTFSLFTGYGTAVAAGAHLEMSKYVLEHGSLPDGFEGVPMKRDLLQESTYDDLIRRWAQTTGRPVRDLP